MTRLCQARFSMPVLIAIGLAVAGAEVGTGAAHAAASESLEVDADDEINTLLRDFKDLSSTSLSDFEWSVRLDDILLQSSAGHIPYLLALSRNMTHNSRRAMAQDEIFRRFASLDAEYAIAFAKSFSTQLRSRFTDIVLSEWAMNDLEGAVGWAAEISLFYERKRVLERIAETRDDLSDDYLRQILIEYGLEEFGGGAMDVTDRSGTPEDPELAWFDALDESTDYVNNPQLQSIARAWFDEDGLNVLDRIEESIPYWRARQSLLQTALLHAATSDPSTAFAKALDMFVDSNWNLILTVASSWTRKNPDAAEKAFQAVESDALRRRLHDVATEQLIRDNPQLLLERLEMLPDALRAIGPHGTVALIENLTPEVATRLIGEVEEGKQGFARSLMSRLATENFDEALAWTLATPDLDEVRTDLLSNLLDEADEDKTVRAVEAMLSRSTNDDGEIGLEAYAIGMLAQRNPNRAQEMLSRVREGETRLISYASVGVGFLHHNKHNRALALGSQLSGSQQLRYFDGIYEVWSDTDPKRAYGNIGRLPSVEAKSRGALWLLKRNSSHSVLSDRQTKRLETLLAKEDAQQLNDEISANVK